MKTNKCLVLLLMVIAIIQSSCDRQEKKKIVPDDVVLNNKGFDFLKSYYSDCDESCLDSALCYFEKAHLSNENNSIPYENMKMVLGIQGNFDALLSCLSEDLNRLDNDEVLKKAELYFAKATVYNAIGDSLSENRMVHFASIEFEKCFDEKHVSYDFVVSYLYFVAYSEGKETALLKLYDFKDVFPDEESYFAIKTTLEDFNKNDFSSYPHC